MNKVIELGRLVRDPEVRYSNSAEPVAIARFTIAVNRKMKKEGQPDADFIPCVAFGKTGEFVEKYFTKGQQVCIAGRLQTRTWENNDGNKKFAMEVAVEEVNFAGDKAGNKSNATSSNDNDTGFYPINENIEDDDLPFN